MPKFCKKRKDSSWKKERKIKLYYSAFYIKNKMIKFALFINNDMTQLIGHFVHSRDFSGNGIFSITYLWQQVGLLYLYVSFPDLKSQCYIHRYAECQTRVLHKPKKSIWSQSKTWFKIDKNTFHWLLNQQNNFQ